MSEEIIGTLIQTFSVSGEVNDVPTSGYIDLKTGELDDLATTDKSDLVSAINEVCDDLSKTKYDVYSELSNQFGVESTLVDGYIDGNGNISASSGAYASVTTDFVEVGYGRSITLTARFAKSGNRLWVQHNWYDADKNMIGTRNNDIDNDTGDNFIVTIKNNKASAKYIRFSFRTNLHQSDTSYKMTSWKLYISNTTEYIDYITNEINSLKDSDAKQNNDIARSSLYDAFVPRMPRFCFSKGKMWVEHWNTIEAYIAAAQDASCSVISGDVRLSADGKFVMYHDDTIDAHTDGTGTVSAMTYAELQEVNVNKGVWRNLEWVGKIDGSTAKIPLLSDFLDVCRKYGKIAFIEVKDSTDSAWSNAKYDELIGIIKSNGMQDSVFMSVHSSKMSYLRNNYQWLVQTALLDDNFNQTNIDRYIGVNNMNISGHTDSMTQELVDYVRSNGKLVHAYTTRKQYDKDIIKAISLGCDIIAVNHPIPVSALRSVYTDNTLVDFDRTGTPYGRNNVGTKIKVMSYNLANYNNDTTVYISDDQLVALRHLLGDIDADYIGTQEDGTYIDGTSGSGGTGTQNAFDYVFSPQYAVRIGSGGHCLYAKKKFGSGNAGDERVEITGPDDVKVVRWGKVVIGTKTLLICNVHCTVGDGYIEHRKTTLEKTIEFANTKVSEDDGDYVIITGDFNSKNKIDRDNMQTVCSASGYTMANGGRFGWMKTNKSGTSIDNILVNKNCIINNVTAHESAFASLHSDHIPLSASITLLE